MTPASGVKRYHSEVVPLQNVPRAIKSSPDNQEYLRGQRVYHCGGNYQLTPYSAAKDSRRFKLGSTSAEVRSIMGNPSIVNEQSNADGSTSAKYYYGSSSVSFYNNRVLSYWTEDVSLRVNIGDAKPNAPAITRGSTKADVIKAMGTPSGITIFSWYYGTSTVTLEFTTGLVTNWKQGDVLLRVK